MATLIRPPPPTITTRQGKKPYFTLHKHTNAIMAWETASTEKMAVVAFARASDIHIMGSMIENHHENTREWPDFRKMTLSIGPFDKPLSILDVCKWSDIEKLKVFCVEHYFDLIIVENMTESYNIRGSVYSLSIPLEAHVPYLEKMLIPQPPV